MSRFIPILFLIFVSANFPMLKAQEKATSSKRIEKTVLQKTYQIIIIGGGPAGLSCGQRCAKWGFSTLVINASLEKNRQSEFPVPNWPGFPNNTWTQIIEALKKDYAKSGGAYFEGEVSSITKSQNRFYVSIGKELLSCDICVIATGKKPATPECKISPNQALRTLLRYYNPDFLVQNDSVSLIGDDAHTLQTALEVSNLVNKVYIFSHTAYLDMKAPSLEALQNRKNVKFISYDRLIGITNQAKNVYIEYSKNNSKFIQNSSWVLFTDLLHPQSEIASRITEVDSKGAITTFDTSGSTHTPGLYSCGEATCNEFLTGAFSAASGVKTGARICRELFENGILPASTPKIQPEELKVEKQPEVQPSMR